MLTHFSLAQSPLATRLDFFVEAASIPEAIRQLADQSGVSISFSDNFFPTASRLSLRVKQKSVATILEKILSNTAVAFRQVDTQIILYKKARPLRKFTVKGYIKAADDGESLIAATIYAPQHQQGAISNEYGFFSLTLPEGATTLVCSYLGAQEKRLEVQLDRSQSLDIELERAITLAEVEVYPEEESGQQLFSTSPNASEMAIGQLGRIPDLGGEPDLLRASQLLPGVQTGADGLGGLHIRGGNADQNLMLLDGVPIYNPNHLLGVFSVFNTSAIRDAKLIKGAFPARYGGRISSIFDVRTREGNKKKWSGELGTGLVSTKATIEGPLAKGRGALLLTGRHTHSQLLFDSIARSVFFHDLSGPLNYRFYDLNTKANYTFSPKDRLFFSFYKGGDRFQALDEEEEFAEYYHSLESDLSWGNLLTSLRWNHVFGNRLFANTTFTVSNYFYRNILLQEEQEFDYWPMESFNEYIYLEYASDIMDLAAKIDFDFVPSPAHYVRFGLGLTDHTFRPGIIFLEGDVEDVDLSNDSLTIEDFSGTEELESVKAFEFYSYLEDEFQWGRHWQINYGLRLSGFGTENQWYARLEPRLSARYKIGRKWSVHAGLSRMVQYLHRLTAIGISKPDDVWIPSDEDIEPQDSWQTGLGLQYIAPRKLEISLEAYFKEMNNLLSFDDTTFFLQPGLPLTENNLLNGSGQAYGLELLVKKDFGKTGGHLAYGLAWAKRHFPGLNLGFEYPFLYDRRHQFSLFLFHKFSQQLECSLSFQYGSANPLFAIQDDLAIGISRVPLNAVGEKNESRDLAYHRLDLSLIYNLHKPRFQHTFKLGAYNAYNQSNEAFYRLNELDEESALAPVSFLPLLPSFSYSFRF